MQDRARAVIVGAGIAGASIAYHLAELGWREVAVVEQGELVSGTTSHAPGLVGQLRSSVSLAKMLMYSVALYKELRLDGEAGFQGEGSLRVASTKERMEQVRTQAALAERIGLGARLVTPKEAVELFPLLNPAGVEGGLFIPDDGSASAPVLAGALVREAQARGVTFYPQARVERIEVAGGRVRAVVTARGRIETDTLVLAAGIWSPRVGRLAGVAVPLTPLQHQYAVTTPLPELAGRTVPNLRDPDKLFYLRQRGQSLVIGGYERGARPFDVDAIPEGPDPTVRPFDPARFEPLRRGTAERVPAVSGTGWERQVNGLESFTPDGEFLLGPAPGVQGVWAACGFCAHGVSGGGGVGKVMAEWIVHGDPGLDLSAMALARFGGKMPAADALRAAACQVYNTYYDIR